LAHAPPDCAGVLHHGYSGNARLLQGQAWLPMFGDVAGSAGVRHRGARPAGDSFPLRRAAPPTANPERYDDELLDAHLSVEDADALYAEYEAQGVKFTRRLGNTPWRERGIVVKDCDGRLLAFGANL